MKRGVVLLNAGILAAVIGLVLAAKTSAWTGVDIGDDPAIGSDSYDPNSGKWTLQGNGHDIWSSADAFHYVYKYLKGDGSLTARVISIGGPSTHEWRKAGVMMREDLTDGSRHATTVMTPTEGHSAAFQFRYSKDQGSDSFHSGSYLFPYWVRVVREGDTFTGYISSDGNDWQQQGLSLYIEMRDDRRVYAGCYIGLCLTSHESGTLASAEFDNVSFTGSVTDEPPPILKAFNPQPPNGAGYVTTSLFQWTEGDTAKWHDVYFGTNPTPGPAEFITRQDANVYEHDADLLPNTTYSWCINEVEADSNTIHIGDVWSFTTAPPTAWNPNPGNGASFVDLDEDLSWFAGMNATTHDVYLGTDKAAVVDGNSGTFKGNQSYTTFDPGTLARYTTYYWRVDEVEADGSTRHTGDVWSFTTRPRSATYDISASSYVGGNDANDSVRGCAIQSDGTVVLAANISDAAPGGLEPILLNDATGSSPGAILRLSPDGTTVLSVTRLADLVLDLVVDDSNNIYVALWTQGMVKLNPTATSVLWSKTPESGNIMRLDAGPTGYCITLKTSASDPDTDFPGRGWIRVYDPNGIELGDDFPGGGIDPGDYPGYSRTHDVCIDEASQTVIHTGWRQDYVPIPGWPDNGAVQVAYVQGRTYMGDILWTAYDWSVEPGSDRFLNRSDNNMADTRGYRCCIGRDGKLYCAFIFHGGIHMQRYDPFDIMKPVEVVGGDMWFETWNTGDIHETFVGRYEPATGEYLLGQQFTCRLSDTTGNTVTVHAGEICADELGRVYVGGRAAWGLPLPGHPAYTANPGQIAFNPLPNDPLKGAWLMVLSPDLSTRLYCTRLTFEQTHAIAARVLSGGLAHIVFGGYSTSELYTQAAIQETLQGDQDGWFAVIPPKAVPTILYVDSNAPGEESGTSWSDAFTCLQDALYAAITSADVGEVRVAQGVYTPDIGSLMTRGDRTATFQLINGIAIKGGYAGFDEPDPNARDIYAYETILSGDLDGNDVEVNDPCDLPTEPTRAENSRHVVTGSGTDPTAILDGFTITGGYVHDLWPANGGGLFNVGGNPTIIECTFSGNSAGTGGGVGNRDGSCPLLRYCTLKKNYGSNGGGMYNRHSSSPILTDCLFSGNWGGMYNQDNSNPNLTNCTFSKNVGGMYNVGSSPSLTNCTFTASKGTGMLNWYSSPTLVNCTFTDNQGWYGGGMRNDESAPNLIGCTFSGNSAERGGGSYNDAKSNPTLTDCTFSANSAVRSGGGMHNSGHPTLTNCTFSANSAEWGGGMSNSSNCWPTLTNCTFIGNSANECGGGMSIGRTASPMLRGCTFRDNSANEGGGGIYNDSSSATVTNFCTFTGNSAYAGGGLFNARDARPKLIGCVLSANLAVYGGGMHNSGWGEYGATPTVTNCTFSGNSASEHGGGIHNGIYCYSSLTNCIFWGDTPMEIYLDQSTAVITYCNVQGGWPGEGNINADPCFVAEGHWVDVNDPNILVEPSDPNAIWLAGDYHLLSTSPCIETGDPNFVAGPNDVDMDGQPRVVGSRVDIGADEFAYIGDFDFNGSVDMPDFATFALAWLSEPTDANWNPHCDISIPADYSINTLDLSVLVDNWLAGL